MTVCPIAMNTQDIAAGPVQQPQILPAVAGKSPAFQPAAQIKLEARAACPFLDRHSDQFLP